MQSYFDFDAKPARHSRLNRDRVFDETKPQHSTAAAKVLAFVRSQGSRGATRHEIAEALSMPLSGVCGRVAELLKEEACFVVPGFVRKTRHGKNADLVFSGVQLQEVLIEYGL